MTFNAFIQPICLFTSDFNNITNGSVAGWGAIDDYDTTADVAKITELQIFDTFSCVLDDVILGRIAWKDSFCARSDEGGVCGGDSGSGFYIDIQNVKYLKGLVSSAIKRDCSEKGAVLYSDVTKYIEFIKVRNFEVVTKVKQKCLF
jgi:hypothetical protein